MTGIDRAAAPTTGTAPPAMVEAFQQAAAAPMVPTPVDVPARRAAQRRRSDELFADFAEPCPHPVDTADHLVAGPGGLTQVRVYRPGGARGPLAPHLVLHGGGWWLGSIDEDVVDHTCRWRAHDAGVAVVALEYRLAPEHPFPAALDDAWSALHWLAAGGAGPDIDPTRLSVGGASAGANLAAALCLRTGRLAGPAISFAALEVPAVDLSRWTVAAPPEAVEGGDGHVAGGRAANASADRDEKDLREAAAMYLATPDMAADPLASPLLADDLRVLPPTLVVTAEHDPLRPDGVALAAALRAAGVDVTHLDVAGAVHAAPYLTGCWPPARGWRQAVDQAVGRAARIGREAPHVA